MSNAKVITQRFPFTCPKVNRRVHLTFESRQFFDDEHAAPLTVTAPAIRGCEGECECGVRPQTSPTSWGKADWGLCVYPNLSSNGSLQSR